jgi:hypothetical protein
MFRKGKSGWRTAVLVGLLLFAAGPGRGMARQGPGLRLNGWENAWEWIASWFGGPRAVAAPGASGPAVHRGAHEKSSAGIDPLGSSAQSDSSLGIDPLGLTAPGSSAQSDSSSQIDPLGKH